MLLKSQVRLKHTWELAWVSEGKLCETPSKFRNFRGRLAVIVSTSNFETHKSSLSHGRIATQRSFDLDIYGDNPNNKWRLTKPESVLNPNQCLALITILTRVKAAAWRFNQLNNCVLPRKALCWPYLVPRKILSAFYTPLQTNSLSSRKSTQQGANKFYSSITLASATEAFFMAHVPVEPEPAAVAAIAPAEPRAEPEPVPAPPVEVSCFYYFLPLPLFLSFCYLRGVCIDPHSVVEVVYVGAVRRRCNVFLIRKFHNSCLFPLITVISIGCVSP